MCRFFGASRSGYYGYVKRMDKPVWDLPLAEKILARDAYSTMPIHRKGIFQNQIKSEEILSMVKLVVITLSKFIFRESTRRKTKRKRLG